MRSVVRTGIDVALILLLLLLAQGLRAEVIITQLANDGVILSDGGKARLMIDGMVTEPYSLYGGLPKEDVDLFFKAAGPFSGIELALVSHQHPEHNQPGAACRFLQTSTGTFFVSSSQVIDLMREKCRQFMTTSSRVRAIDPQVDRPEILTVEGAKVTVFPLSHGVGSYATLKNFAHLVEIGGVRVLDVGDAAMDSTDFERAGVAGMKVDVALIPFWYFQPGPGGDIVRRFLNTPHQIAVHIPPGEMQEVQEYLRTEFPEVMVLDETLEQVRISPAAPPPP
jgi:L-ascorbate metabolism protein UlaG (beta-lactamase superfamily)